MSEAFALQLNRQSPEVTSQGGSTIQSSDLPAGEYQDVEQATPFLSSGKIR